MYAWVEVLRCPFDWVEVLELGQRLGHLGVLASGRDDCDLSETSDPQMLHSWFFSRAQIPLLSVMTGEGA